MANSFSAQIEGVVWLDEFGVRRGEVCAPDDANEGSGELMLDEPVVEDIVILLA